MSKYFTYTFSFFVFPLLKCIFAFPFPEFESVQTIKLIVSSKIKFGVLFLIYSLLFRIFSESLSCNQLSHEAYIDYQTTQTASRNTATSKMELFVNIFDTFYFLIIITKSSVLDEDRYFPLA